MSTHRFLHLPSTTLLILLLSSPRLAAQPEPLNQLEITAVAVGLDGITSITHAPGDGRLFVTLQEGRIVVIRNGQVLGQNFLDIRGRVLDGGERGLLSVAFSPNFRQNRFFFVNYTNASGATVVSRFRATTDRTRGDAGSEQVLLTIGQPFGNHNGGQLQFGPDGRLYIGMGDGGSANDPICAGQRTDTLLGKLLRLNVNQAGAQPEVWASGLRNPWRFSFDRRTGDLYIADVGQNQREEVNFQPANAGPGANYGWKMMEGSLCLGSSAGCGGPIPGCNAPEYTPPVLEYTHGGGRCSITGGYVYRGNAIDGLAGYYFYGDLCAGTVWAARRQGGTWRSEALPFSAFGLTTFGEDDQGEITWVQERWSTASKGPHHHRHHRRHHHHRSLG